MMPTARDHNMCILDEPITHHLNVPRNDNSGSVLFLTSDLQKHDDRQLFQSSKQAFSLPFCLVWMTIGCLIYMLQHSLCMDSGELSWFPEPGIFSDPSTLWSSRIQGDQPIIPGEGSTEWVHWLSYVQRHLGVHVLFLGEQAPGGGSDIYMYEFNILGYGLCLIMCNISCSHVPLKYVVILGRLQCLWRLVNLFLSFSEEKKSLQFPKLHPLSHLLIKTSS